MKPTVALLLLSICALVLSACQAGPGHTRAAGAVGGATGGALLGAAIGGADGHAGEGAVIGGILGYMAGATAGEGIAQDQERYNSPPHRGGRVVRRRPARGYVIVDEVRAVEPPVPPPGGYVVYYPNPPRYVIYAPHPGR